MNPAVLLRAAAGPVPAAVSDAVRAANRIALAGHVTPDADCIGSIGALVLGLRQMGKQSYVSMPEGSVARRLTYLANLYELTPASLDDLRSCDLLIGLDTARERRLNIDGKLDALPDIAVLNVDHHDTNTRYGKWDWVQGDASSVCQMVYDLLVTLECEITPTIATLLYAGIHGDTQGFSLSNTTAKSLATGHALAAAGANVRELCEKVQRSNSKSEFDLLKVIYANSRVSDDGRIAWSTASYEEITGAGCRAADIDDQVEVPRSVEDIYLAILFTEGVKGKIRMNFRGESGVSALGLAQRFGGGGHRASAGAILDGTVQDVSARVLSEARAYLADLPEH